MSELDQEKKKAFAGKMVGILNGGALALMTSIGRQTGLFEVMATLPGATSEEIAIAAQLNERYVREWLGGMVTGGIIEYDPSTQAYTLPPEHAAVLTNAAGPGNMARFMQYLPMMAEVETDIIECFHNGGGVPYAKYPRFLTLMSESSGLRFDNLLLGKVIPLTEMVMRLEEGIKVLDIGCGHGHASNLLAKAFPQSHFTGFDFSSEGIKVGQKEAEAMGNTNVQFAVQDLAAMNEPGRYDLITAFDVIHDQAKPAAVLKSVAGALKPDGTFLMMDFRASSHLEDNIDHPFAPFIYGISTMHCMTVSLALDGEGLGTAWGEQTAVRMLNEAGFTNVAVHQLQEDALNNYYIARKA